MRDEPAGETAPRREDPKRMANSGGGDGPWPTECLAVGWAADRNFAFGGHLDVYEAYAAVVDLT